MNAPDRPLPATFTGIPSDRAAAMWSVVEPVLLPAILRSNGRHTALTTRRAILDDKMQLWACFDDALMTRCRAALVTQTVEYPTGLQEAEIVFCAGEGVLPDCLPLLDIIADWASSVGCHRLRLLGRLGWSKVLPTFAVSAVVLERNLSA